MNNLYFACCDCKIFIDAGYRWAYWGLEHSGIVARNKEISVEAVLAANEYWNPPKDETSRWLYEEIFPPLPGFIKHHESHRIIFGETEDFAPEGDEDIYWNIQTQCCVPPALRNQPLHDLPMHISPGGSGGLGRNGSGVRGQSLAGAAIL